MLLARLSFILSAFLISTSVTSPASNPEQSNPPHRSSSTSLSQHLNIFPTRRHSVKEHVQALRDTRKSLEKHERGWTHRTDKANLSQAFCCFGIREKQRKKADNHHSAIQHGKVSLERLVNQNLDAGPSSPKTRKKLKNEMNQATKKLQRFPRQEDHRRKTNEAHDTQQYIIDHKMDGGSSSDGEDFLIS